jgi:MFS family permease
MKRENQEPLLLSPAFLAINGMLFFSFCNFALFFNFQEYLKSLAIESASQGFIIGVFSLAILVVRPLVSPYLLPGNSRRWIMAGTLLTALAFALYVPALNFSSLVAVRVFHGAVFAILSAAVTGLLVGYIPPARSAQAFGLISIIILLPYAVVPPLLEPLIRWAGNFPRVLLFSGFVMLAILPLLALVKETPGTAAASQKKVLTDQEIRENFKNVPVLVVFFITLCLWCSYTPVFFYLKKYGDSIGVPNAGIFFTLSTCTEIGVRLAAGSLFDRLDKKWVLAASLAWCAVGTLALGHVRIPLLFYGLGLFLGLGWGVSMPVLNSLVFDVSQERTRAFNTNISMVMMQGGFFLGPLAGSYMLYHWNYGSLFPACTVALLAAVAAVPLLKVRV